MDLAKEAQGIQEQLVKWRRDLHQIPEVGMKVPNTSAYIQAQLKEMDIPFETYCDNCAIVATIGKGGKVIALRSDMDALAIPEETGLPFASKNGNMHACGHDTHATMLLGAAKLLKAHEAELPGTVKLFWQPAEETFEGAKAMLAAGVLEEHKPTAILNMHNQPNTDFPAGTILVSDGGIMASGDFFDIRVKGKGCHGAMPESGVDPVTIAAQVIHAVQTMVAREISSQESAVVSICSIRSRTADEEQYQKVYNVIPNCVEMAGTIRTLNKDVREYVVKRLGEIVEGVCKTARAEGTCDIKPVAPVLYNSKEYADKVEATARKLFGDQWVVHYNKPTMASEDAAFFLDLLPGNYVNIVAPKACSDGKVYPLHNSHFCFDEDVLYRGSALFAQSAFDWLAE